VDRLVKYAGNDVDPGARVSSQGFVAGYDAAIGRELVVGVSGADSAPDLQLEGVSDQTTSRILQIGFYGRYKHQASHLAVIGGASGLTNKTTRSVIDGFTSSTTHAAYDGGNLFSRIEYGFAFQLGKTVSVEPQMGFQYSRVTFDGFTEDGAGVLNLVAPVRRQSSQRSITGGKAVKTFRRATGAGVAVEARAAWAHEFTPLDSVRMRFLGDTAANGFDLASPARVHNSAVLGASLVGDAFKHIKLFSNVDGDVSGPIKLWTVGVGLRAGW
jgi:outer membrane autotransporter protein